MGQQPLGSLFQCLAPCHPHTSCLGSQEQRLAPITKGKASKQIKEQNSSAGKQIYQLFTQLYEALYCNFYSPSMFSSNKTLHLAPVSNQRTNQLYE